MNLSRTASQDNESRAMSGDDSILMAFEAYGRISKVPVKVSSVVSQLADMHHDICNSAAEKRAAIIVLPYNVYQEDGPIEHIIHPGLRTVNQRVMQNSPCSVCVFVDRGPWSSTQLSDTTISHNIAVIFFGGPDDREALAFGCRLAEHPCIKLTAIRFKQIEGVQSQVDHVIHIEDADMIKAENKRDEDYLVTIMAFGAGSAEKDTLQSIFYEEQIYEDDPAAAVVSFAINSKYLLMLVGRQSTKLRNSDTLELGVIGDALANAGGEAMPSLVVIQQHNSSFTGPNSTNVS